MCIVSGASNSPRVKPSLGDLMLFETLLYSPKKLPRKEFERREGDGKQENTDGEDGNAQEKEIKLDEQLQTNRSIDGRGLF
jgi:hypothetical protein